MHRVPVRRVGTIFSVVVLVGLVLPGSRAAAASTGPTVVAVHRNAAVDVRGNSTYGGVASVALAAGNWLITANATIEGTDVVNRVECQLVAGTDVYEGRTWPANTGVASLQAMTLLLGHHFSTPGAAKLKCYSDGVTGDVLIRDVRLTAVKVGKLTTDAGATGSGSPRAFATANNSLRFVAHNAFTEVGFLTLPAGQWLVEGAGWGVSTSTGATRLDCKLEDTSEDIDITTTTMIGIRGHSFAVVGVVTFEGADTVHLYCQPEFDSGIGQSAISALKIGKLTNRVDSQPPVTTGSGTPVVVASSTTTPFFLPSGPTLQQVASLPLPAGHWVVTAKIAHVTAAPATVTCQLRFGSDVDQGRVKIRDTDVLSNWMFFQLTHTLAGEGSVALWCDESAAANQVAAHQLEIVALKAGTLSDKPLN